MAAGPETRLDSRSGSLIIECAVSAVPGGSFFVSLGEVVLAGSGPCSAPFRVSGTLVVGEQECIPAGPPVTLSPGGDIRGTGRVGPLTVGTANVEPGHVLVPGILSCGNLSMQSNGYLVIDIEGSTAGPTTISSR